MLGNHIETVEAEIYHSDFPHHAVKVDSSLYFFCVSDSDIGSLYFHIQKRPKDQTELNGEN